MAILVAVFLGPIIVAGFPMLLGLIANRYFKRVSTHRRAAISSAVAGAGITIPLALVDFDARAGIGAMIGIAVIAAVVGLISFPFALYITRKQPTSAIRTTFN